MRCAGDWRTKSAMRGVLGEREDREGLEEGVERRGRREEGGVKGMQETLSPAWHPSHNPVITIHFVINYKKSAR